MKQISLINGNEGFVIKYEVGEEARVLDHLVDMVNNRDLKFDWYDAAVMAHQIGRELAKELKTFVPKAAL